MDIFIGFDPRETDGYTVTRESIYTHSTESEVHTFGLVLPQLRRRGLYTRPTSIKNGHLWDDISAAPMATEFAISRFLTPILAKSFGYTGWVLFMDCDMLVRAPLQQLFDQFDDDYAVACVKHNHGTGEPIKMDNCEQLYYYRKNWSSVMAFNLAHPANAGLTTELVNTRPGRDLHAFCWLKEDQIQAISADWNHLVKVNAPNPDAKIAHFTMGVPRMSGYEDSEHADEWWKILNDWAENG